MEVGEAVGATDVGCTVGVVGKVELGAIRGGVVGVDVGIRVLLVGGAVGTLEGRHVGDIEGLEVVGLRVGSEVGTPVGKSVGENDMLGPCDTVGLLEGLYVGSIDGPLVGNVVGPRDGRRDGFNVVGDEVVGFFVGDAVGDLAGIARVIPDATHDCFVSQHGRKYS